MRIKVQKLTIWILAAFVIGALVISVDGQVKEVGMTCEESKAALDFIGSRFRQQANSETRLVIIAASNSAKYRADDLSRIKQAVRYFASPHGIDASRVDYGTRIEKTRLSRMRFYLDGKLSIEVLSSPRGRFCYGEGGILPL